MSDPITRLNEALEGRYRIESELGEGGMATVYLADDIKHERKVALKVLKPELAAVVGAERFLAEIKTTANLQHPHILPLFDSGEADSFLFYVMPYVEGETLRDRLEREKQLPVEEAVRIATDVAEALHSAHEQGVIHRDIKPANILMSKGRPLVADFGIALAVAQAGGGRLTETGLSMGTPYYMSPEQASADREPTPASDVYSLGCVLYEMLAGEPPYTGGSAQAVLAKILMGEAPNPTATRSSIPANVDAVIRKALEKLPADRFTDAQEFGRALADRSFRHGEAAAPATTVPTGTRTWAVSATLVATLSTVALAVSLFWPTADGSTTPVVRFAVPVGEAAEVYLGGAEGTTFGRPSVTSLAISRDGDLLVYSAWELRPDGTAVSQLYLRRLDQERADAIPDTEGGYGPFFSPDGTSLGFQVEGALKRVSLAEGTTATIAQVDLSAVSFDPTWGDNDTIVFVEDGALYQVPATSGEVQLLAAVDTMPPGFRHLQGHMLPGSRTLLFAARPSRPDFEQAEIFALDLATMSRTSLLKNATNPHYVDTGHLLFVRQGTLMAVRFDLDRTEISDEPFIVLEDVMQAIAMPNTDWETGTAQIAVSPAGHLAYARGGVFPPTSSELVRLTSDGEEEPFGLGSRDYGRVRVSPEGDRIAYMVWQGRSASLHVYDFARRSSRVLNTGGFVNSDPEWSPDGLSIAFDSDREGDVSNIYRMAADDSEVPERLAPSDQTQQMMSWSSQGDIAYLQDGDLWVLPPGGEPAPFFTSDAPESHGTFSPDGRWLAYVADEGGGSEVYARPYPGPGVPTLISDEGGANPAWSPDGRQVYFLADGMMWAADIIQGDQLVVAPAELRIAPWRYSAYRPSRRYDVLPDGSIITARDESGDEGRAGIRQRFKVREFHVVLNFFEELRQRTSN